MHESAYRIGELVMHTYCDLANAQILEIGSMDVNGSLRDAAEPTTHYVGLDLEEGPGVDIVIKPGDKLPFDEDSFDLIMASSAFEHDPRFWETFLEMCRVARPGGHIYVNAPSNGGVHRYPMDCWRLYPDAGVALADYAQTRGMEIELVESFVGNRSTDSWDGWNDFVAIFRKGPSETPPNIDFVYKKYPSCNARTWNSSDLDLETALTEDMQLGRDLRQKLAEREDRQETTTAELGEVNNKLGLAEKRLQKTKREIDRHLSKIGQLEKDQAEAERQGEQLTTGLRMAEAEAVHLRSAIAGLEQQAASLSAALQIQTDALAQTLARDQAQIDALHADLAELRSEHALQTEHATAELALLRKHESELGEKLKEVNALRIEATFRSEVAEADALARQGQIEDLSNQLLHAQRYRAGMDWLRAVHLALSRRPFWWFILSEPSRRRREYGLLRKAGLFDGAAYLARHPDVSADGADPLYHYIAHGMHEGRDRGFGC